MARARLTFLTLMCLSLGVATSARAQSAAAGSTPTPASAPSPSEPPAKKVWTNDDLTGLPPVSTVGPSHSATPKPAAKASQSSKSYQDQIARLQDQIPPIDSQIAELQAAIDGKPTGDGKDSSRPRYVKIDDWSVQMQQLQKKRDDLESRIASLEDQARRHSAAAVK